jgi:hypothetical protein
LKYLPGRLGKKTTAGTACADLLLIPIRAMDSHRVNTTADLQRAVADSSLFFHHFSADSQARPVFQGPHASMATQEAARQK